MRRLYPKTSAGYQPGLREPWPSARPPERCRGPIVTEDRCQRYHSLLSGKTTTDRQQNRVEFTICPAPKTPRRLTSAAAHRAGVELKLRNWEGSRTSCLLTAAGGILYLDLIVQLGCREGGKEWDGSRGSSYRLMISRRSTANLGFKDAGLIYYCSLRRVSTSGTFYSEPVVRV